MRWVGDQEKKICRPGEERRSIGCEFLACIASIRLVFRIEAHALKVDEFPG